MAKQKKTGSGGTAPTIGRKSSTDASLRKRRAGTYTNKNKKKKSELTVSEWLLQCANTVATVFELLGCTVPPHAQRQATLEKAVANWLPKVVSAGKVKFIKYKLAAFYSLNMEQVLPLKPFPQEDDASVIIGGVYGRWFRLFKHLHGGKHYDAANHHFLFNPTFVELLSSVLNSKSGMPRAGKDEIAAKEVATAMHLTTEQVDPESGDLTVSWADMMDNDVEDHLSKETMKAQLKRTVHEIFGKKKYTTSDRLRMMLPSTSSNYLNTRSEAGAIGHILNSGLLDPYRVEGGHLKVDKVENAEEELESDLPQFRYDEEKLKVPYSHFWFDLLHKATKEEPLVKMKGLPEALKVRVISQGPPLTYTVLKSLWKFVHSTLRRLDPFKLIGEPDTALLMQDLLKINDTSTLRKWFLSGDYAAATDNLRSWVSECICDAISDELELLEEERVLFKRSLTQHWFLLEDVIKHQKTGQLMGSISSFPILCIANFAATRWALEVAEKRVIPLNDAPIAINGDDVVARGPKTLRKIWSRITNFAGLTESIGKTFFDRDFFNINSRTYIRQEPQQVIVPSRTDDRLVTRTQSWIKTKFINTGLIAGYQRSGAANQAFNLTDKRYTAASVSKALVEDTPASVLPAVYSHWLARVGDELKATRLPWFIPEWLGGLGLTPIKPGSNSNNGSEDLKRARAIILNYKSCRPQSLSVIDTPWFLREIAARKVPHAHNSSILLTNKNAAAVKAESRLNQLAVIDLLFDSKYPISRLYKEAEGNRYDRILQHNRKIWSSNNLICGTPIDERLLTLHKSYTGLLVAPYGEPLPQITQSEITRSLKRVSQDLIRLDLDPLD